MKQISLNKINDLLTACGEKRRVYLPTADTTGQTYFSQWKGDTQDADILHALQNTLNTVRSPKDLFFPQVENLMGFRVTGKQIELVENRDTTEDFVLFGVRACDAKSFEILDKVFLAEPVDTYYQTRREHGLVITLACSRPAETCFCGTFGIDAANPAGDISCWIAGDVLYWQANTEKGKQFTDVLDVLEDASEDAVEAEKEKIHAILDRLPLKSLTTEGFDEEHTLELWGSDKWASLSESCLGCGTCTFVCPTCQCYDIQDFNTGSEIKRYRCWDSCMYSDFTKMSAGQPRPTQLERFRQRFMHKLVYFPTNNDGEYSCVGCGRCLQKCPISMNIVKVMKTLQEK